MIADPKHDLLGGLGRTLRMPVLGNLRPGIKKLKSGHTELDKKIYEQMVAQGAMWYEIEQKLGTDKDGKTKLIPGNEDYFTVRPSDCRVNPNNAKILQDLYADEDGHIRCVPVVFMFNDWEQNIPHELSCWTANSLKYRSDYRQDGSGNWERICVSPVPHKKGERPFGGRDVTVVRPCDPKGCKEYQDKKCTLRGYVQCIIPGAIGAGLWKIETRSFYSLRQIMETMILVGKITGRIVGLYRDGKPVFTLRKVEDTISQVDVTKGESIKREQDLIYLDANIDMAELALAYQEQNVLERGKQAQALLAGEEHRTEIKQPAKIYNLQHPTDNITNAPVVDETETEQKAPAHQTANSDFIPEVIDEKEEAIKRCKTLFDNLPLPLKKEYKKAYPKQIEDYEFDVIQKIEEALNLALATMV